MTERKYEKAKPADTTVVRSLEDYDRLAKAHHQATAADPATIGRRAADAILRDVRERFRASQG
ncbi:MAG: hypothetical protein HY263_07500 [Chloroflexi bacterium]|nr:hypothetical protein [Chloroflexota bacterium]